MKLTLNPSTLKITVLGAVMLGGLLTSHVSAQISGESNTSYSTSQVFPALSSNDLLLGATPTSANLTGQNGATGTFSETDTSRLTDGDVGTPGSESGALLIGDGGATLTYSLGSNATGYDITGVESYTAWDQGTRTPQYYTISFSTNNGASYTVDPYTVNYTTAQTTAAAGALVSLTGSLSNVTDVEFTFANSQPFDYASYTELAVIGTPSAATMTPEPSTMSLMMAGLLVCVGTALRRRKSLVA